ncbi:MAG: hypothetical protein WCI75_15810 [candidate division NC10 bacterium]
MGGNGAALTLHRTLAVDRRLVVVILALAALLWVIRGQHHPYQGGWDWGRTGLAVGVVGVAACVTSAMTGHPTGLGTVQSSDGAKDRRNPQLSTTRPTRAAGYHLDVGLNLKIVAKDFVWKPLAQVQDGLQVAFPPCLAKSRPHYLATCVV